MDGNQDTALPGGGSGRSSGLAATLVDVVDRLLDGRNLLRVFVRDPVSNSSSSAITSSTVSSESAPRSSTEGRLIRHLFLFDAQLLGDDRLPRCSMLLIVVGIL
jgi:hypothetical protein